MPKEKHSPISDDEAEDMVKRMITDAEDLGQMADVDDWHDFITSKLFNERGQDISAAQFDLLDRGRSMFQQDIAVAGAQPISFMRRGVEVRAIRDIVTGRFTSLTKLQQMITPYKL